MSGTTEIIMKELILENCNFRYVVNEGGVFGKSFITYKIRTLPLNWEVSRRYNDFFQMRNFLKKNCPGVYIPPIPTKKAVGKMEYSLDHGL